MPKSDFAIEKFKEIENLQVKENIPLKDYTSLKVGGPADIFLIPDNLSALKNAYKLINEDSIPYFILGKGSNIIVSDYGFRGIIIYMGNLNKVQISNQKIIAETGISLNILANKAMEAGLTGLEFASGIPGSLGGALYMNAGAYGGEMKDVISSAILINDKGQEITLNNEQLELAYRHSILQEKDYIGIKVILNLKSGDRKQILDKMKELNQKRRDKQPLTWPSAGSTFKRPEGYYTGPLIEKAGLKGAQVGDAQISTKHAGFIINLGNATAQDVKKLIEMVQDKIYKENEVHLFPEPKFIGKFD